VEDENANVNASGSVNGDVDDLRNGYENVNVTRSGNGLYQDDDDDDGGGVRLLLPLLPLLQPLLHLQ